MSSARGEKLSSAYLIQGHAEHLPALHAFLSRAGIAVAGNPDIYERQYLNFGVDDARELRQRASSRPVAGAQRVFIAVTPKMTTDAQNALLKTLEEPPADATFFFIIPAPETLLPTLRSRAQRLELSIGALGADAKRFLGATSEKRIEHIKELLEKTDDDERDVRGAVALLQALERELSRKTSDAEVREGLAAIYRARAYMMDKGSLLKPLMEQVALLVPKI